MRNNSLPASKYLLILLLWVIPGMLLAANRSTGLMFPEPGQPLIRLPELPRSVHEAEAADTDARVIIDHETGEIVKGYRLALGEARVDYQDLHLDIRLPASGENKGGKPSTNSVLQPVTIGQVVTALLTLSVQPDEIIAILKTLIHEGALRAILIVQ